MSERYAAKPFLELVDAWMLDAIGALPADRAAALTAREGEFATLFGERGGWRDMVVTRMNFPAGMAGAVREVWDKGRVRFVEANGHDPDSGEFVRTFVDTNFPH
ncbi:hypothetical protein [Sphingomonas sp. RS2018]